MQDEASVKKAYAELSGMMGTLSYFEGLGFFSTFEKVWGTNPRTTLSGQLWGFGSLQTRGDGRRSRLQDSALASKKEKARERER